MLGVIFEYFYVYVSLVYIKINSKIITQFLMNA